MMFIDRCVVGQIGCNCYIVGCEKTGEGVVIDAGGDADVIVDLIRKNKLNIGHILCTHGHFDHIEGLSELSKHLQSPIFIHQDDAALYEDIASQGMRFGMLMQPVPPIGGFLIDGQEIAFGNLSLRVIHTPGHTKGGVCFYHNGTLFSGDTLFEHSVGRTDLPGGSMSDLIDSITTKLLCLPEDTVVYPGHGEKTTIGFEKRHNPFL